MTGKKRKWGMGSPDMSKKKASCMMDRCGRWCSRYIHLYRPRLNEFRPLRTFHLAQPLCWPYT